uniref:Uncharacterized protein n=1 Tax=Amphimedon queenslandica TaxID=400682 RepID=A0A1X7SLE7_AMPQE
MAERKRSKESKGIDGEEGTGPTDGSKQKGGGGEKDNQMQKRVSRLGGAAHYVHKRVKGQPKSTLKKKEGKSSFPPSLAQETWSPTPWQNTTQPLAVISSVETLSSTEGATPPTALKYDDHD